MSVQITDLKLIPFIDARVQAGFPSPAEGYLEKPINLHDEIVKNPSSTFVFTCSGDSLIGAFIPLKAWIVIDRSITPKTGSIVLATIHGEFTVKYYDQTQLSCWLVPANIKYQPIKVTEEMEMTIWGVITKIIFDPNDVPYVRPGGLQ